MKEKTLYKILFWASIAAFVTNLAYGICLVLGLSF